MPTRQPSSGPAGAGPPPAASRNRQIVVCCDGTNNTLTGGVKDTNVVQLFELLRAERARLGREDPQGPGQVLYYDPGVGSPTGLPPTGVTGLLTARLRRVAGLALGTGIYENIGQAYLHLCREYGRLDVGEPGTKDEIYLFGFSRGAFTARAVGGMVNLFGLIRPEHEPLLPTLLRVYFAGDGSTASAGELGDLLGDGLSRAGGSDPTIGRGPGAPTQLLEAARVRMDQQPGRMVSGDGMVASGALTRRGVSEQIRAEFTSPIGRRAVVHFLGVWDTVDSVGILPGARTRISSRPSIAGKRYRHVRHALALDEHRRQFLPRYFDPEISPGQTLEQVWFRGVHSDIGGTRPARRSLLSFETLDWMTHEAMACGLRVAAPRPADHPGAIVEVIGDQLRAQPAWALTGMALRDPGPVAGHGVVASPGEPSPPRPPAREHPSVARFSLRGPGSMTPGVPGSPWERGNGPRPYALLLQVALYLIVGAACLVAAGALATPGPAGTRVADAADAGLRLLTDQLGLFWGARPSGAEWAGRPSIAWRLEPASTRFEAWAALDRDGAQASYGWALLLTLGTTFSVAAVVARLPARAFGRVTRWGRVTTPYPRPRWFPNAVGLGFAVMVLAFAAQTVALALAWAVGRSTLRWPLLALAAEAGVVAAVGALLLVGLLCWWGWRELWPRPSRARSAD